MSLLELRGVSKKFRDVTAVDGVSLAVEAGEFCVLLGPSGCGKSTLLRLVAGLEDLTAGDVVIDGRVVNAVEPGDRDIAMVFQSYALYPHLTVRENLEFPLRVRKVADPARVRETAELLQLTEQLGRYPRELSGGQRQRVAIGRAIVRRPKLFLFDEPLSNLDAQLRGAMRVELARLHRHLKATVLYVTHDQVEAMTLGTRIALLNRGRIEQVGPPAGLYERPATLFAATFIGSPAMNLLPPPSELAPPSGAKTLGVRPEDLEFAEGPWRGTVDLVENLGADSFAHVKVDGRTIVVRGRASAGASVSLRPRTVHWFNEAGRRI